ncbi:metal-dependent hydrolase [Listeria ilorinensis]|uniref:metal-dependent hydrolase n=1 Tax=Listeria ilorinensis TaxID=2867439 RepID=UPI001EF699C7|nr:metal-dependent hydrolase [Listeria ilorinensis]
MKISFHGQSCVKIVTGSKTILIDPFISGNEKCDLRVAEEMPDYILLSHGHDDHVGDTVQLAKQSGATIICNNELALFLRLQGLENLAPMHIGGKRTFDFGWIKLTQAFHGSATVVDGQLVNLGLPTGILLHIEGQTIYHAGDTGLFSDMKLIGDLHPLALAFLPIGDNFTMGPEDAKLAADFLQAKIVVPMHYNTFPLIEQDPYKFIDSLSDGITGKVMAIGDEIEL